jgi:hypothetical protein
MSFGLLRKHALCFVSVALALPVLLVCILHRDLFVYHVLSVHVGDGGIRGLEVAEGDEAVALGDANVVARDLCILLA